MSSQLELVVRLEGLDVGRQDGGEPVELRCAEQRHPPTGWNVARVDHPTTFVTDDRFEHAYDTRSDHRQFVRGDLYLRGAPGEHVGEHRGVDVSAGQDDRDALPLDTFAFG
jgi:hypothetical protein